MRHDLASLAFPALPTLPTLSIAGHPAFAGVDVGSVHDTLAVCPPGYQLVFGGSQARDVLAALAAAFFA